MRQSEEEGIQKETQATTTAPEQIETGAEELPIEDYDSLNVKQVSQRLRDLSVEEIEMLRDYEAENRNRRSLMERFERRIRVVREDLKKSSSAEKTEEAPREDIRSIVRASIRRSRREV